MLRNRVLLIGILTIFALVVSACGTKVAGSNEVIHIGWAGPLTGGVAEDGKGVLNAVRLAVDQVNAAGGVKGRKIELHPEDDKCDPKEAAAIANKFASDSRIVAVIGNFCSSATLAGIPVYKSVKMPQVAPASSAPSLTGASPYFRRVIVTDALQGAEVSKWAYNDLKYRKAAIFYENTDFGLGLANVYEQEFKKLGGQIVAKETYQARQTTDYSTIVTKFQSAAPDVIFAGSLYPDAAAYLKQAQRVGFKAPMMGATALFTDELIKLAGDAAEGLRVTGSFYSDVPDPLVKSFVSDYKAKHNAVPNTFAAFGYDATKVLVEALKSADKIERDSINNALLKLAPYQGVTGETKFTVGGDAIKPLMKLRVLGGKFILEK